MNKDNKTASPKRMGGLGKGLGALLPENHYDDDSIPTSVPLKEESIKENAIYEIAVDQIENNPFQPRIEFEEEALLELAESISEHGLVQPITVRRLSENQFQLISGERRLRASKLAGLTMIPAYVRTADNEQMIEFALIENIQRKDLNPLEIAMGYQRLMDECKLNTEQTAKKVGKSRPTVTHFLSLLKLPAEIQLGLKEEKVTMGHVKPLFGVDNPVIQLHIYHKTINENLNVRQVEEEVRNIGKPKPAILQSKTPDDSQRLIVIKDLQRSLENQWNTKVKIQVGDQGKGEIKISFYSDDDLSRLIELLQS